MKNSNLNNEYLDDEIDLIEFLRTILNSKKLIIIVTLAFSILAFIYTTQKELEYQSTIIVEVGSYRLLNGKINFFEETSQLTKKLKIDLIYRKQIGEKKIKFVSIEDTLLKISYISLAPDSSENFLKKTLKFIQEGHSEIQTNLINSFFGEIKDLESQIDFLKNSSLSNKESKKLEVTKEISRIDAAVELTKIKINFVSELLLSQKNDLNLKNQLKTLEASVEDLVRKKGNLEKKMKLIDSSDLVAQDVFDLKVEKNRLEKQIELIKNSSNKTQPIREIETTKVKTNTLLIILIGTILGFIFSIFIVYARQAFLKEKN
jgi:LPS O-antigen subunit length determinant protein (WzzB/FepE family)